MCSHQQFGRSPRIDPLLAVVMETRLPRGERRRKCKPKGTFIRLGNGAAWPVHHGGRHDPDRHRRLLRGAVAVDPENRRGTFGDLLQAAAVQGEITVVDSGSVLVAHSDLSLSNPAVPMSDYGRLVLGSGGRASIHGDFHGGGQVRIELGAADQYAETAALTVAGLTTWLGDASEIHVSLVDDFVPQRGDEFRLITATSAPVSVPDLPEPLVWAVIETGSEVRVRVIIPIDADLDGDGQVNVFDLLFLLSFWGPCPGEAGCDGDLNSDGEVNVFDLLDLLAAWG